MFVERRTIKGNLEDWFGELWVAATSGKIEIFACKVVGGPYFLLNPDVLLGACIRDFATDDIVARDGTLYYAVRLQSSGGAQSSAEVQPVSRTQHDGLIQAEAHIGDHPLDHTSSQAKRGFINFSPIITGRNARFRWSEGAQAATAVIGKAGRLPQSKRLFLDTLQVSDPQGVAPSDSEKTKFIARNFRRIHGLQDSRIIPELINMEQDGEKGELRIDYVILEGIMLRARGGRRLPKEPRALAQVIFDVAEVAGPEIGQLPEFSDLEAAMDFGKQFLGLFWDAVVEESPA